jgi:uncharacterized protein YbaR (Trm112 family)
MFIELIEVLRCPRAHEESWLVAAFEKAEGRVILDGRLGCPVCGAEYPITRGIAVFGRPANATPADRREGEADHWRTAALLDLRQDELAVLYGDACAAAAALLDLLPLRVIAVNACGDLQPRERLAIIQAPAGIPLRTGVAAGVAVDRTPPAVLADAVRVLRHSGRLLMPGDTAIPQGFSELARDEREVVALKEIGARGVQLKRGPRATG